MDRFFMWVFIILCVSSTLLGVLNWIAYGHEAAEMDFVKAMLAYLFVVDCQRDLAVSNA